MAKVVPEGWRELAAIGAALRENETLGLLADGLPETYTIYHGLHWTRIDKGYALVGEIDFAIVTPAGRTLLIEQKCGFLKETPDGLCKMYGAKEKSIPFQIGRSMDALHKRLGKSCPDTHFHLDSLLYCPDYLVKDRGSAGIDPARIVDASHRDQLLAIIRNILPSDDPPHPDIDRLHRFLGDELKLVPNVQAIAGQARTLYTRISGGLATWARQIECKPFRLRVIGTAGSGKTQLALAVFNEAVAACRRPLYVCYNRPLADHFARIVASGGEVATYHQLADRVLHAYGEAPDFTQPAAFGRLESFMDTFRPEGSWLFDELIVDEGQDFKEEWKNNLLRMLRPEGRAWWMEDPMQNLYGRPPVDLSGWVILRSGLNYRSPQDVLDHLNRFLPESNRVSAGSPLTESEVEVLTYNGAADLITQTKRAITISLGAGFKRDMMAIVTYRGREHSALTPYDTLGNFPLRAFTGAYDLFGNPVFTAGDILIDSIYRFKGQSAACILFTEIDFERFDDLVLRKLFVGMTRATMKLILIISEHSARIMLHYLSDETQHLPLEAPSAHGLTH